MFLRGNKYEYESGKNQDEGTAWIKAIKLEVQQRFYSIDDPRAYQRRIPRVVRQ